MQNRIKAFLSDKRPSFWLWLSALLAGTTCLLLLYVMLFFTQKTRGQEETIASGAQVDITLATGEISGNMRRLAPPPSPVVTDASPVPTEAASGVTAPDASTAIPEDAVSTYVNPETAPDTTPDHPELSPAARIPPRDNPEVTETPLSPPAQPTPAEPTAPAAPVIHTNSADVLAPLNAELMEQTDNGPLPIISKTGVKSWQHYARRFTNPEKKPFIAIVITDLGHSKESNEAALTLPPEMSFVLSPYATHGATWAKIARTYGHEIVVNLPLQPKDYPTSDPGPYALLTENTVEENINRLHWALTRAAGVIGVMAPQNEVLSGTPSALDPLLAELKKRGIMLLLTNPDNASLFRSKYDITAMADLTVDERLTTESINEQLAKLEVAAKARGYAIGIAHPYPLTIDALKIWSESLPKRDMLLAPLSAATAIKPGAPAAAPTGAAAAHGEAAPAAEHH